MASPLTHAVVAATVASGFRVSRGSIRCVLLGIVCAEVPDLDAIGFWLGVPYESMFGHRGITHSILFALVMSGGVARWAMRWGGCSGGLLWAYLFLATLSHSALDAMTDGGLGVAFLSPFDLTRYFFPFRPIRVSSMSLWDVLGAHGLSVLANEMLWVWWPCGLIVCWIWWMDRRRPGVVSSSE